MVSIKAPDASTVVVTLKEPSSYIMQRLANTITGEMGAIYPKEAAGGFDPKQSQIGTGPFMLDKFTPSVSVDYKRNPDYWDSSAGFLDAVKLPNIPEYAGQLAQFKTGALSSMAVSPEDIIQTKKDTSALAMYQVTPATNNPGAAMRFGWLPIGDKKSPFLDIRVRQALSMAFDRDTHIDTFSNVSKFAAAGLPINTYYNTAQGYVPGITLDPRDTKTFGENSKYFTYDLAEAKKLFEAAKSAYGSDFPEIPSGTVAAVFGAVYTQECAVMDQYAQDLGFKVASSSLDYNIDYLGKYVTKQGQLSGIFYGIGAVTSPSSTDYYVWKYYSKSGATSGSLGFGGPDGSLGDKSGDPQIDALIEQAKGEFDSTKNSAILGDLQRALAKEMYQISRPGFADTFEMAWPAIGNFATFQGESRVILIGTNGISQYWFDPTKASKP